MLALSIVLNAALLIAALVIYRRAQHVILEEKLATMSGCLAAMTNALALEDTSKRFDAAAFGLASFYRRTDETEAEMKFRVTRASLLRMFRPACLADLGEHLRLLALQAASSDDTQADPILLHISEPQAGPDGVVTEPADKFGGDAIAAAQFAEERRMLELYAAGLTKPFKLFGRA